MWEDVGSGSEGYRASRNDVEPRDLSDATRRPLDHWPNHSNPADSADFDYAVITTPSTYSSRSLTTNASCPFTDCSVQGISTDTLSATSASPTGTASPSATTSKSAAGRAGIGAFGSGGGLGVGGLGGLFGLTVLVGVVSWVTAGLSWSEIVI